MAKPKYDEANSFLMGAESVPTASFLTKGTEHEGEILELAMRQQLDIDTRKPLFWDNGDPKMQLVITVQTDERDNEIEDDDGRRRLYVKYKMRDAISDAVREADCVEDGLQVGGWLRVKWVKSEKAQNRAKSGAKLYEAEYEPPDPSAAANAYLNSDDPDEGDDGNEPEPPKRGRSKPAANKPAAAKAGTRPSRRRAPEPEPDDDDGDDDEPEPPPKRGRKPAAKAASSARSSRGRSRSEFTDDGDDGEPF